MARLVNSKVLKVVSNKTKKVTATKGKLTTALQQAKPFSPTEQAPEKLMRVKSTNLKSFSYDNALRELTVTFLKGNRTYVYYNVPSVAYLKMLNNNTPGEYHYKNIRLRYTYAEISGTTRSAKTPK